MISFGIGTGTQALVEGHDGIKLHGEGFRHFVILSHHIMAFRIIPFSVEVIFVAFHSIQT